MNMHTVQHSREYKTIMIVTMGSWLMVEVTCGDDGKLFITGEFNNTPRPASFMLKMVCEIYHK